MRYRLGVSWLISNMIRSPRPGVCRHGQRRCSLPHLVGPATQLWSGFGGVTTESKKVTHHTQFLWFIVGYTGIYIYMYVCIYIYTYGSYIIPILIYTYIYTYISNTPLLGMIYDGLLPCFFLGRFMNCGSEAHICAILILVVMRRTHVGAPWQPRPLCRTEPVTVLVDMEFSNENCSSDSSVTVYSWWFWSVDIGTGLMNDLFIWDPSYQNVPLDMAHFRSANRRCEMCVLEVSRRTTCFRWQAQESRDVQRTPPCDSQIGDTPYAVKVGNFKFLA